MKKFYTCCASGSNEGNASAVHQLLRDAGVKFSSRPIPAVDCISFDPPDDWSVRQRHHFQQKLVKALGTCVMPVCHGCRSPQVAYQCGCWCSDQPTVLACAACVEACHLPACERCSATPAPLWWPAPDLKGPRRKVVNAYTRLYRAQASAALEAAGAWSLLDYAEADEYFDRFLVAAERLCDLERAWVAAGIRWDEITPAFDAVERGQCELLINFARERRAHPEWTDGDLWRKSRDAISAIAALWPQPAADVPRKMRCYCCRQDIAVARKVKLRPSPWHHFTREPVYPNGIAYLSYREEMTYRWAFICNGCYRLLDNALGVGEIPGRGEFNLAGASRGDKATTVDYAKYEKFQRQQAEAMGLEY